MITNLPPLTKKDLKEFNQVEAQGWIINSAIKIEEYLNYIIFQYFDPKRPKLFRSHILNSSIMSFGSKLKVLNAILDYSKETNSLISKIQKLMAIRNAFAHNNTRNNLKFNLYNGGESKAKLWTEDTINVMNSQGKIIAKNNYDYMIEFLELYEYVEPILKKILEDLVNLAKSKFGQFPLGIPL